MTEPKPCPFCKGKDLRTWYLEPYAKPWIVQCTQCGAQGPHDITKEDAIESWNQGVKE